jgi:hypothetical protein
VQCRSSDEGVQVRPPAGGPQIPLCACTLGDTRVCPGREEVMGEMSPSDSPHPYSKSVSSRSGRGIPSAG